ncbi:hypothetical protein UFOVP862_22 [uncultured Caudovirales phage]|uniref:Uncharacterized protein n=1 Tax=uncultured Caudovirales phage TaxID=2100421 RepID=A0A6J5PCB2_9CAUD|nr:hypothetical protein UFOVP862_22 [uncultured Caudovirales phage]
MVLVPRGMGVRQVAAVAAVLSIKTVQQVVRVAVAVESPQLEEQAPADKEVKAATATL